VRLLLIVEDEHDIRTAMAALLSEVGYSVCDAADVSRALEKLRSLSPDLVLLDYALPSPKHGEDFLRTKAADPQIAAIPVIVLSGYELPSEIHGTVAVIGKPFDFDRLVALIHRVIGPPQRPSASAVA
jgi:CheY-like chemotaxis protein